MTLIERIHQEINSYKNLKDGWDGDDSFRPSDRTINNAINFVNSLGNLLELIDEDYIYPTGDGTIVIDFQNDNGDLVSVEIRETKPLEIKKEKTLDDLTREDYLASIPYNRKSFAISKSYRKTYGKI